MKQKVNLDVSGLADPEGIMPRAIPDRIKLAFDAREFRSALRALENDAVVISVMSFLKGQEGVYRYLGLPSSSFNGHGWGGLKPDRRTAMDRALDELQNPMWPEYTRRALELTPSGFQITRRGQAGHIWPSAMLTTNNMLGVMSNGVTVLEIRDQIYCFARALSEGTVSKSSDSRIRYNYPGQINEYLGNAKRM